MTRTGAPEFVVPSDWSRSRVRRHLAERLNIRDEGVERGLQYFDTFDWLLHRAGFVLELVPGGEPVARLVRLADGRVEQQRLEGSPPRFPRDWPRGPVKALATGVTEERALLPVVKLAGSADRLAVLNRDGKTVCRLSVEKWRVESATAEAATRVSRVRVIPLRGWRAEAESVSDALADAGLPPAGTPMLDTALTAVGREVRDYSQKFRLALSPHQDAASASRAILARLFDDLERNEEGTRHDIDPEFLHDYRVAVRRTRSAMSAFGKVFDADALAPHAGAFRDLGRLTGDKRNLDVHLIDFDGHLELLDEAQRAAMAELRRELEAQCQEAGNALASYLKSAAYRAFKRDYRRFLDRPVASGPAAGMAVHRFADQVLWKAYRRIVKDGRAITRKSPDAELHELRKRGKKFRYLMEFFQSLYPPKPMKGAIAELKRLQDRLGLFQDQCVQMETLESLRSDDTGELASGAIDRLLAGLARQRQDSRAHFAEHFARFDTRDNRRRYAALFKPRAPE